MAGERVLAKTADTVKSFLTVDGKHYRKFSVNMQPVMDRVAYLNEKVNGATRAENRQGYQYLGSIPKTMLVDWLNKHGYTMHDFAVNAGGQKGKTDPRGSGVKDKFMRYFMSRDFAKLHTQHLSVKRPDSGLIYTGGK